MCRVLFIFASLYALTIGSLRAESLQAFAKGELPNDIRLQDPKDLNGYFPFTPPRSLDEWEARANFVRRQILVSQGLWPMPTKGALNAVIHGAIDCDEYTVEKVYFESAPGFFVTGNLYRPKARQGRVPAVLFAHGHWQDARLSEQNTDLTRKEIATGQERFEVGGRSRFQSMCVQLARMGCVVWQWDMLSDSDSKQLSREVVHKFAKQRPEMNTTENWGLYSPQAEAHLQSIMGLQTWNAVRSLDFVLSLPEVDPERIAITGASGGGTQTMLLAAIDPRIKLSFPAVMVSTAMQGGCTCENASLLRINTGNVEFAALFAPKPQGMTTANDWTREMSTKGFPELEQLYKLYNASKNVMLQRGEHFPHNYNAVTRSAFYTWLNKHFKLGWEEPVIERDYRLLSREELSVWNAQHAAPTANDPEFERRLLQWFTKDSQEQLQKCMSSPEQLRSVLGGGIEAILGRSYDKAGTVEWKLTEKADRGNWIEMSGRLTNTTYQEELPVLWLYPKNWNGRAMIWLDDSGKSGLLGADGTLRKEVARLVDNGFTVLGADLLYQGEFLSTSEKVTQTRVVANPREFAGYTFGYNHALFAQRVHDVLTLVSFLRTAKVGAHPSPKSVSIVGLDGTGIVLTAARSLAGKAIDHAAIDTHGFRFGQLRDFRAPQFLPGGAKYLDIPGMIALQAPHATWLAGESESASRLSEVYQRTGDIEQLTFAGDHQASESALSAVDWILKSP